MPARCRLGVRAIFKNFPFIFCLYRVVEELLVKCYRSLSCTAGVRETRKESENWETHSRLQGRVACEGHYLLGDIFSTAPSSCDLPLCQGRSGEVFSDTPPPLFLNHKSIPESDLGQQSTLGNQARHDLIFELSPKLLETATPRIGPLCVQ